MLEGCRRKVAAGDEVLSTAEEGIAQWSAHVRAQTDANARRITESEMDEIFERTRDAGEKDVVMYAAAKDDYDAERGRCPEVPGAPADLSEQLADCQSRDEAQQAVLAAADAGMEDWERHLADMRKSAKGKLHNPAAKWRRTYQAAPRHINAYHKAADEFDAPDC